MKIPSLDELAANQSLQPSEQCRLFIVEDEEEEGTIPDVDTVEQQKEFDGQDEDQQEEEEKVPHRDNIQEEGSSESDKDIQGQQEIAKKVSEKKKPVSMISGKQQPEKLFKVLPA